MSVCSAADVYWSDWVLRVMGEDEPGEFDDGISRSCENDTIGMKHCRRVSFVDLASPTRVTSGEGATVPADGPCEAESLPPRDG